MEKSWFEREKETRKPPTYTRPSSSADTVHSPLLSVAAKAKAKTTAASSHFSPNDTFDMNHITRAQLMSIGGIGETLSDNFIEHRAELQKKGLIFTSPADLKKVKGIGKKTYEKVAHRFFVKDS